MEVSNMSSEEIRRAKKKKDGSQGPMIYQLRFPEKWKPDDP